MPQVGTLESLIVNNAPRSQDCTNVWFLQLGTFQIRFNGLTLHSIPYKSVLTYCVPLTFQLLYLVTSHYNSFMASTKLLDCTNL